MSLASIRDASADFLKVIKSKLEVKGTDTATFVLMGAGGTVAVCAVGMALHHFLGKNELELKQKLTSQRQRLIAARRKSLAASSAGSSASSASAASASSFSSSSSARGAPSAANKQAAARKERVFAQLRSAYVENKELLKHGGGCHCGCVRFVVEAPAELDCIDSDRSMDTLCGRFPHLVVPKSRVMLVAGSIDHLRDYHFGGQGQEQEAADLQNLFCTNCGVHCFGYNEAQGTMHVNTMCLDMTEVERINVAFDGDREAGFRMSRPLAAAATAASPRRHHRHHHHRHHHEGVFVDEFGSANIPAPAAALQNFAPTGAVKEAPPLATDPATPHGQRVPLADVDWSPAGCVDVSGRGGGSARVRPRQGGG
jgi:hypothetical protein